MPHCRGDYKLVTKFVILAIVLTGAPCYNANTMEHFEIERKYLIRRPTESYLRENAVRSDIVQTYLLSEPGQTERVRSRRSSEAVCYTHTVKIRLSAMRRIENEREITAAEYERLLRRADPSRRPIEKQRWVLGWHGQNFEIDLFPFWTKQAYLELELDDESQQIDFPPEITVLREVTDDKRYTNASLAREIPAEETEGDGI